MRALSRDSIENFSDLVKILYAAYTSAIYGKVCKKLLDRPMPGMLQAPELEAKKGVAELISHIHMAKRLMAELQVTESERDNEIIATSLSSTGLSLVDCVEMSIRETYDKPLELSKDQAKVLANLISDTLSCVGNLYTLMSFDYLGENPVDVAIRRLTNPSVSDKIITIAAEALEKDFLFRLYPAGLDPRKTDPLIAGFPALTTEELRSKINPVFSREERHFAFSALAGGAGLAWVTYGVFHLYSNVLVADEKSPILPVLNHMSYNKIRPCFEKHESKLKELRHKVAAAIGKPLAKSASNFDAFD